MKSYICKKGRYNVHVIYPGYLVILAGIFCVWKLIATQGLIYAFILVIVVYTIWNTFVSSNNPSKVEITEDKISFTSIRTTDVYHFSEIETFQVKDFPTAKKIFLRINGGDLFKGRYWLTCDMFVNGNELYQDILGLEERFDPENLHVYSRKQRKAAHAERIKASQLEKKAKEEKRSQKEC